MLDTEGIKTPAPGKGESMNTEIKRLESGARMSGAVIHGGVVYLAGQVGQGDDVTAQSRAALAEVDRLLALAGSNKSRILSTTVWLADIADFAAMNAVWDAWIDPANPPARATGEAKLATPYYRVEFIVTAAL
jgi:enamine deaminase RidA (YjgF/YER057c/UK114 family)